MRTLARSILLLLAILVGFHTLVRIIRRIYKFPMPEFLASLIDNPLRRRFQPRTKRRSVTASSRG